TRSSQLFPTQPLNSLDLARCGHLQFFSMSKGALLLLTGVMVAAAIQVRALNPLAQQWVQRFHSPGSGNNYPTGIAVDSKGNVFVTGYELSSNGYPDYDFVTLKYSATGVPLWTNYYDGSAHNFDHALALALDRTGNAYVTGISHGGDSGYDYATIAYSNNG